MVAAVAGSVDDRSETLVAVIYDPQSSGQKKKKKKQQPKKTKQSLLMNFQCNRAPAHHSVPAVCL